MHLPSFLRRPIQIQWPLFVGIVAVPGILLAQTNDGVTLTFPAGPTPLLGTFITSINAATVTNIVFSPTATINQGLSINTPGVAVTAGVDSGISSPSTANFALNFSNSGGSLNANGMTLTSAAGVNGALGFTQAGTVELTNSSVTTSSPTAAAAAVRFQAGGSLTMTGGSLTSAPSSPDNSRLGYILRSSGGTMALSLENVALIGGTSTSHQSYGIALQGGGSVTLKGTSTTVIARGKPALDLNGEYTVTSLADLKSLQPYSADIGGNAVALAGGSTNFTNLAQGVIHGNSTNNLYAYNLDATATGSKLTNHGQIDGVNSGIVAAAVSDFELTNTGTIATTGAIPAVGIFGGKIKNQGTGTISGGLYGPGIATYTNSGPLEVTNSSVITGATGILQSTGAFSILNEISGSISGTAVGTGTYQGISIYGTRSEGILTNRGMISGNQGVIIQSSATAEDGTITVVNSGQISAAISTGLQAASYSGDFASDVSITNEVGGLIQGGLVNPSYYHIMNAAIYARNGSSGDIEIHNYGTIDARSQTHAIGVEASGFTQATITLHDSSTTIGAIRGLGSGVGTSSIALAFSGNGSYSYDVSGVGTFRKSDAGTWTYSGERGGSSVEVSGGELILTHRTTASGVRVNVSNGTLRVAPPTATGPGLVNLSNNDADIGAEGKLILTANSRGNFGGNAGVQTIHDGGLLQVDGFAGFSTSANFACSVENNGRFAGEGEITGYVKFLSGGALEIGDGTAGDAGDLALVSLYSGSALTFGDGGVFRWSLAAFSDSNPGSDFDQVILSQLSSVVFQSGSKFDLDLSAVSGAPDPSESINPFWQSNHSWPLISGGTVTTPENLKFSATDQATYPISGVGTFSFSMDGRNLIWTAEPVTDPFVAWIDSFPSITDPLKKTKTADADGDGLSNLTEFAYDGDPSDPANSGKSRGIVSEISGSRYFSLTLPVRNGAIFSGPGDLVSAPISSLVYQVQGSLNLVDFTTAELVEITPALAAGLPALSSTAWQYRSFRLADPITTQPHGFIRSAVQAAP